MRVVCSGVAFAALLLFTACPLSFELPDAGPTDAGSTDAGSPPDPTPVVVAHAGNDVLVPPGESVVLDAGASFALDGRPLSFRWSQLQGPPITLSDPAAKVTRFRAPADPTELLFQVTTRDGAESATDFVTIHVRDGTVDAPPFAIAGADLEAKTGQQITLDARDSWDRDGDPVSFEWYQLGVGDLTEPLTTEDRLTLTTPVDPGWMVLRLLVRDALLTSKDDIIIRVREPLTQNHPPEGEFSAPTAVDPGAVVVLFGTGTDPQDDPIRYVWRQLDGPRVELELDGRRARFIAPRRAASLAFQLVVSDSDLASAPLPIPVEVTTGQDNRAPLADAGADFEVEVSTPVTLDASGSSDPDQDPIVTYEWLQIGGTPVTPEGTPGQRFSFFAPDLPGELIFSLTVFDGVVQSTPDTVRVTVLPAP